jgi:hypothetical protein
LNWHQLPPVRRPPGQTYTFFCRDRIMKALGDGFSTLPTKFPGRSSRLTGKRIDDPFRRIRNHCIWSVPGRVKIHWSLGRWR